ncbi:MAG TPA: tetratricopeptide repeat protein [Pyrinomonadaceae bacterium]|jgi:tetratricopeptide (TPR) repeat protein|nr:tetratricopeptide repeat protein [Pyrinomonadaceae bacterium]
MQSKFALIATAALCLVLSAAASARAQGDAESARLERVASLISSDRMQEAEQQLNAILKAKPDDTLALNLLGTVRAKQGRLDEAEALFARALRADKEFVGAHMNLAYLYLLKNEPEKTVKELRETHRLVPDDADVSYKLAHLLLTLGRADECVAVIEEARRLSQLTPPLLTVLGDAYLKKGDAGKAEESYRAALGARGDNADALLGLALISQSKGDAASASAYLSRVKELILDSPESLYRFAVVALRSERFDDAKGALERAVQLKPDEPAYLVALGAVWLKQPELFEAERVFRQALKLQPDNAQAQMYLGYTLLKQKKYPEAREWLEKSAGKVTSAPETFYYLGLIAQEQNEDERAVDLFERAVRLTPSFAVAHIALGSTYLKLKNYERARQELEAGVRLKPDDSKAHYNLARLYALLKDPQRAQAEMAIVERLKNAGKAQTQEADIATPSSPR